MSFSSSAAAVSYVPEFLAYTETVVALPPTHFSIQSLSDFVAGLPEELLLCPVRALSEFVARTSRVVNRPRRLFVSSRCSSRAMSSKSIFSCCEKSLLILAPAPGMLRPLGHTVFTA